MQTNQIFQHLLYFIGHWRAWHIGRHLNLPSHLFTSLHSRYFVKVFSFRQNFNLSHVPGYIIACFWLFPRSKHSTISPVFVKENPRSTPQFPQQLLQRNQDSFFHVSIFYQPGFVPTNLTKFFLPIISLTVTTSLLTMDTFRSLLTSL